MAAVAQRIETLDRLNHLLPMLEGLNHLVQMDAPGSLERILPPVAFLQSDAETVVSAVADLKLAIRGLERRLVEITEELRAAIRT